MKNKRIAAILTACLLILLPVLLSGCEEQPGSSQSASSVAEPTQAPSQEPSSLPESVSEPSQEPEPTEAPAGFEEVFAENPIDSQLADALDTASSSSAILKAYEKAGQYWKAMVPLAYDAAKAVVSEDDRAQLDEDQKVWEDTIDDRIAAIREENGEESDGKITSARLISERYRETAKALCEVIYSNTGELPDFTPAMSDEPKG